MMKHVTTAEQAPTNSEKSFFPKNIRREYLRTYRYTDNPMHERSNRIARILLRTAGTLSLILGGVGIILPLLPTTPFLLLAAVCYARSSERWYNWLLTNRWFGEYIRNWHEGRGIPIKTKILTIAFLILTIGYSAAFVVPFFIGKVGLILIAICVSMHILSFPTLEPDAGV